MSKRRLIPKLQLKRSVNNGDRLVLVVTRNFEEPIEIGDPVSQAKIFQDQGADELVFIDIEKVKNRENSVEQLAKVIYQVSKEIFTPISVGGGVNTLDDFRLLLSNGADKICINTIAINNPEFIEKAAGKFGVQCIVVSIDYKKNSSNEYKVYKDGGRVETNLTPLEWALEVEKRGAGEILLSCIDKDGVKDGLELALSKKISNSVKIPTILSGGCGVASDFSDGFLKANVDAVSAGTFFAHRDQNLMETRAQIKNAGVNIRSKK
jgi:cyclase